MPSFNYKAVTHEKKLVEGVLTAKDLEEAANLIGKQGLTPVTIKERNDKKLVRGGIPIVDKITFCRYMGIMLSTGLSLTEGIEVLRNETKNPVLKQILEDMLYGLEQGQQLSNIFERYPGVFENYFLTLVRAGEVSGKLAEVFIHLETELRAEYSLKSKVKGALMYPIIIFIAMIGIGILMFFFVLPQIGKVFLSLNLPLAAPTRILFQVSITFSSQVIPIIVLTLLMLVGGFFALRIQTVRDHLIGVLTLIPVVRKLIIKIDIARFCRIFSTLMRSAVPITEALEISLSLMSWKQFRNLNIIIPKEIRKGRSLASALKDQNVFPSLVIQMIAAGEKTATIDTTLADLATFYEGEVEEEVKGLTQIIEPVMMLMVGVTVGAMILSIIAPIYSVVGSFQQAAGGAR
jgi:type II secretory pathway component PulF